MATILYTEKVKLTKVEIRSITKHIKEWFKAHTNRETVRVKLGPLGTHRFHRGKDIKLQVLGVNG